MIISLFQGLTGRLKKRLQRYGVTYKRRSAVWSYIIAVMVVAAVLWLRLEFTFRLPLGVMLFGAFVAATLGGFGAGLLALLLLAFVQFYYFSEPVLSLSLAKLVGPDLGTQINFLVIGFIMVALSSALRYMRRTAARMVSAANRLSAVVESSQDAIIGKDLNGIVTDWNKGAEKLYGYSRREVVGKHISFLVPAERRHELEDITERLGRGENVNLHETVRVDKTGRYLPVQVAISPVYDAKGNIIGAATIARDISERRKREEEQDFLRQANQLLVSSLDYETILQHISQLLVPVLADWCAIDLVDGQEISRVNFVHRNPQLAELSRQMLKRYPWPEDYPHGVPLVLRTGQPELIPEVTDSMLDKEVPDPVQRQTLRTLGLCSQLVVPLKSRGTVVGSISLAYGESGRHYNHNTLMLVESFAASAAAAIENSRHYREVVQSEQQKDEFIAVASHELKTPLTSMKTYAQRILRDAKRRQADEAEVRALELITRQTDRLSSLVNNILDVTKLNNGALVLHRETVSLRELIATVIERINVLVPDRVTFEARADAEVDADPSRIEQAVVNLINNAIAYSDPESPVKVTLSTRGSYAVIAVADQGSGISPKHRQYIFERFSTASGATKGLGLGLYITKQIVDQHGGRIRVQSQVGRGSTFYIELPTLASVKKLSKLLKKEY